MTAHSRGRDCALAGLRLRTRGVESARSFLYPSTGICRAMRNWHRDRSRKDMEKRQYILVFATIAVRKNYLAHSGQKMQYLTSLLYPSTYCRTSPFCRTSPCCRTYTFCRTSPFCHVERSEHILKLQGNLHYVKCPALLRSSPPLRSVGMTIRVGFC